MQPLPAKQKILILKKVVFPQEAKIYPETSPP